MIYHSLTFTFDLRSQPSQCQGQPHAKNQGHRSHYSAVRVVTDGQTDWHYQTYYLPSCAVDYNGNEQTYQSTDISRAWDINRGTGSGNIPRKVDKWSNRPGVRRKAASHPPPPPQGLAMDSYEPSQDNDQMTIRQLQANGFPKTKWTNVVNLTTC